MRKAVYIVKARDKGMRRWTRVLVAGGKTSRELERALTFDYKHEAEEAARFMTETYALSEFKLAKRG